MITFASDNNAGVHPRMLEIMAEVNRDFVPSYGEDSWTRKAAGIVQDQFGPSAEAHFVFLGTAANVLGLSAVLRPHHAVICAESAHINTDECGALEAMTRSKILPVPHADGKVTPADCLRQLSNCESMHHVCPRALSISQSTEFGTVYNLEELRAIGAFCKEHGLYLHMDGARLANAAAALGVDLKSISTDVGVDVLSFGGTKNGLMLGEAVVFLTPGLSAEFGFIRKQGMQLMSKMRFLAAQFIPYLEEGLWLENARRANGMAAKLAAGLSAIPGIAITRKVDANAIFARLPRKMVKELLRDFYFYIWDERDDNGHAPDSPEVRLMTSFATSEEDVDSLVLAAEKLSE